MNVFRVWHIEQYNGFIIITHPSLYSPFEGLEHSRSFKRVVNISVTAVQQAVYRIYVVALGTSVRHGIPMLADRSLADTSSLPVSVLVPPRRKNCGYSFCLRQPPDHRTRASELVEFGLNATEVETTRRRIPPCMSATEAEGLKTPSDRISLSPKMRRVSRHTCLHD